MTDASDRRQRLEVLRDRANALLREDGGAPALAMDVKQLVHELRVLNTELGLIVLQGGNRPRCGLECGNGPRRQQHRWLW